MGRLSGVEDGRPTPPAPQARQMNIDHNLRVVIDTESMLWQESPAPGVWRKPLEGDGGEIARCTTLVQYDREVHPFPQRQDAGEEIFVIEGTLEDEQGFHPAGTYLRNPPDTHHRHFTSTGCKLFVRLHQFQPGDDQSVRVDTLRAGWRPGLVAGLSVLPLHSYRDETVALVRWRPGTVFRSHAHFGGEEIFVVDGVLEDEHGRYPAGTWLRSPHMSVHTPSSRAGCLIYVRTGMFVCLLTPRLGGLK